jgi:hypothetical protein
MLRVEEPRYSLAAVTWQLRQLTQHKMNNKTFLVAIVIATVNALYEIICTDASPFINAALIVSQL